MQKYFVQCLISSLCGVRVPACARLSQLTAQPCFHLELQKTRLNMAEASIEDPLVGEAQESEYREVTYGQIVQNFVLMGWTAFGGPSAHIAFFETVC